MKLTLAEGMKIALPKEFYGAGLNDEIRKSIMSVASSICKPRR